ncbi:MAG: IS256 family transposase [Acidimicrobiales bacterium]
MAQAPIPQELIDQLLEGYEVPSDLTGPDGLIKQLVGRLIEAASAGELTDHLGYDKGDPAGRGSGNSRNGTTPKTLVTEMGELPVKIARDRNGTFEPLIVEKGQTHWDGFDDKIISMYAGGMTVEEIRSHLADLYDVEVSRDFISRVTDSVLEDVRTWQTRPLDECYPVIWIDALVVKIRVDGVVRNRPAYLVLGLNTEGRKEALSLVVGTGDESAKFWLKVLTDLRNRGLHQVCVVCCDGLTALPEAIEAVYAEAWVQCSLVHDALARERPGCHPHRRERASADRPSRSRRRPVPPVGGGPRTASRSRAMSAITSDGGGRPKRMSRPRRRNSCRATPASTGAAPIINSRLSTTTAVSH